LSSVGGRSGAIGEVNSPGGEAIAAVGTSLAFAFEEARVLELLFAGERDSRPSILRISCFEATRS
jgi:hypothetical protein